jgi:hypothetical protein
MHEQWWMCYLVRAIVPIATAEAPITMGYSTIPLNLNGRRILWLDIKVKLIKLYSVDEKQIRENHPQFELRLDSETSAFP